MIMQRPKIFLDSGAYSAHKKNISINIHDYCDFIKKNKNLFDYYANLDIIGNKGHTSNRGTAEQTLENQNLMEELGLHPLPCFHYGEPFEYLEHYVKNYDHICLGVTNSNSDIIPYLNECFRDHICYPNGEPKVKVHVYGKADIELLLSFPFCSSDATTWMIAGRYGSIIIPQNKGGNWVYNENPYQLAVSTENPKLNKLGAHILTCTYLERQMAQRYIKEKGFTEEEVSDPKGYFKRDALNVQFYADAVNSLNSALPIMFMGVSATFQLRAVCTAKPKMNLMVSYFYCSKDRKLLESIRNYKGT
jgi:hypothetical protein